LCFTVAKLDHGGILHITRVWLPCSQLPDVNPTGLEMQDKLLPETWLVTRLALNSDARPLGIRLEDRHAHSIIPLKDDTAPLLEHGTYDLLG
jgi:hypothetical protein